MYELKKLCYVTETILLLLTTLLITLNSLSLFLPSSDSQAVASSSLQHSNFYDSRNEKIY